MARLTANHNDNNYFVSTDPGFSFLGRDDISDVNHLVVDLTSTFTSNLINDFNFVRVHNRLEQFPRRIEPGVPESRFLSTFP